MRKYDARGANGNDGRGTRDELENKKITKMRSCKDGKIVIGYKVLVDK
jgi:hypothetical protein